MQHVFKVLDFSQEAIDYLKSKGIDNVRRFANLTDDKLKEFEDDRGGTISTGQIIEIVYFRQWLSNYIKDNGSSPDNWNEAFTEGEWDKFVLQQDGSIVSAITRHTNVKTETVEGGKPIQSNVKVDIKAYPAFDGKLTKWKAFKRQFIAIAQTHSLEYLLAKSVDSLMVDEDSEKFKKDNKFLQAALTYALAGSTSISMVLRNDDPPDGRHSWHDLTTWYEGQGSEETIAQQAYAIITQHKLTPNSRGGAELFLEKYQQAMLDLENVGEPVGNKMAKIHLLNNVADDDYKVTVENLRMDDDRDYLNTLQELRKKSIIVEAGRATGGRRKLNTSKQNEKEKDKERKPGKWIQPEKWKKMTKEQQEAHKRQKKKEKETKPQDLPKQYSQAKLTMTDKEKEMFSMMEKAKLDNNKVDEEDLTETQKKFVNLFRTMLLCRRIVYLSQETSAKLNTLSSDDEGGQMLIDGGCDTMLSGKGWEIDSVSARKVKVQGYADQSEALDLPIGTALAAVDLEDQTIVLEANEAILMTENHSSLMSTFQVREFGHTIDDVARRHGGTQSIEADGITIPLAIKKGLFTMKVRPPTAEEKDDCLRIVLTSDQIY